MRRALTILTVVPAAGTATAGLDKHLEAFDA